MMLPEQGRMMGSEEEHYQPWLDRATAEPTRPAPLPTRPAAPRAPNLAPMPDIRDISADDLLARPLPPMSAVGTSQPSVGERIGAALERVGDVAAAANARIEPARRTREAAAMTVSALRQASSATFAASRTAWSRTEPLVRAGIDRAGHMLGDGGKAIANATREGSARIGAHARTALAATPIGGAPAPDIESQLDRLVSGDAPPSRPSADLPLFSETAAAAAPVPPVSEPMAATAPTAPQTTQTPAPQRSGGGSGGGNAGRSSGGGSGFGGGLGGGSWIRHPGTIALGAAALLFGGFAAGQYWTGPGVDHASTEQVVHDYLLNHPEILPQAMERLQANRTTEALGRVRDRVIRPFSGAWAGNADGDVTLVMFSDYACTYCRASLPDVERLLREDPRLKIVFREMPILSRDSEAAARLALAAARRGRYMPMHRALFASGRPDEAARRQAAITLDVANDATVLNDADITAELRGNVAMARELGFDGTPAWVVGNRVLSGAVGYDALKQAIAEARR
jgi:protein-disulfide isomerase/uncharacterized membrane protein YgcG